MFTMIEQLTALTVLSPVQLRAEWRRVYRSPPPRLTPDLLRRGIAYRLQERAQGGLPAGTARQLDRVASRLARGERLEAKHESRLKAGARLVRRWQDKTYTVLVTDDGFILDDRSFTEPRRVCRRLFGLDHAAIGRCSIMA